MKTCLLVGSIVAGAAFVAGFERPMYWAFSGALVALGLLYAWSTRKDARIARLRADRWKEMGYSESDLREFSCAISVARTSDNRRGR
jgi:hypothetical protein